MRLPSRCGGRWWGWSGTHYADFGPTLACEKLEGDHDYRLSVETLRQWMIAEELWQRRAAACDVGCIA